MAKNITIGQYFPGNSFLHKMDPRMKLVLSLVFIISIFLCKNFASLALMVLALGIMVAASKVPLKTILKGIRPILIIIILTALLNIFYVKKGAALVDWDCLPPSLWWCESSA